MKDRLLFLPYTTPQHLYTRTLNLSREKRNGKKETEDGWDRLDMGYRKGCELRIEIGRNGNMAYRESQVPNTACGEDGIDGP